MTPLPFSSSVWTKHSALVHLAEILRKESLLRREVDFTDASKTTLNSVLACHWQFRVCKEEADEYGWGRRRAITWTAGDTLGDFLNQFELPA
jgi:hypothetical protein